MKKLIALAIALIMVLALVPMTLAAELPDGAITVGASEKLVYDLNGTKTGSIVIDGGGELTINGSGTFDGTITIKDGKLTLNGGKYLNTIYIEGAAEVYVGPAVQILAKGNAGIYVRDCDDSTQPDIKIDVHGTVAGQWVGMQTLGTLNTIVTNRVVNIYAGAKLYPLAHEGEGTAAIYGAGYMVWNIYGGSFKGETCLSVKSGVWNISDGEFLADGKYVNLVVANSNGSEDTGAALSITSNDNYAKKIEVNITGGTFVSEQGNAVYEGIAEKNDVAAAEKSNVSGITITNGTFYSEKEAVVLEKVTDLENPPVNITGGTYSDKSVQAYAPEAEITVSTEKPVLTGTNSTIVTVNSEVAYIVIIPAVIDFGTMKKGDDVKEIDFNVTLTDAFLGNNAKIDVSVNSDFAFVEGFEYKLFAQGAVDVAMDGDVYCSFTADGINAGKATCDPVNMPYAGSFTDTMVFTIDYVPAAG